MFASLMDSSNHQILVNLSTVFYINPKDEDSSYLIFNNDKWVVVNHSIIEIREMIESPELDKGDML